MMKKITVKQLMLLSLFVAMAWSASAQLKVGDNPNTINKGSVLELEAKDKGVLYPRVALTAFNAWAPLQGTAVAGMTVYNTATVTATTSATISLSPGFYFWEGAKWNKIATEGEVAQGVEWKDGTVSGTNLIYANQAKAAGNDLVITDEGKMGIGTTAPQAKLDVNGSVKIADGTQGAGKVLTSDATGKASWKNATQYTLKGVIPQNAVTAPAVLDATGTGAIAYTGCYIELPAGAWIVRGTAWLAAQGSDVITPSSSNPGFASLFLSTSPTANTPPVYISDIKSFIIFPLYHGGNEQVEFYGTGEILVKLNEPKILYLWGFIGKAAWGSNLSNVSDESKAQFRSWNLVEGGYGPYTQLYAIPINYK